MQNSSTETFLVVFVALTALALAVQAGILVAAFLTTRKVIASLRSDFEETRDLMMPLLQASRNLFDRVGPKLEPLASDMVVVAGNMKNISSDVAGIAQKLRSEADNMQASTIEIMEKIRHQADRVDSMVTSLLDATEHVATLLQTTVTTPVRQLAGVLAAARAIIESLRNSHVAPPPVHSANDHESFV